MPHETQPQMSATMLHETRPQRNTNMIHETRLQMNDTMLAEELEETPPCPTRRVHAHQTRPQMNATLICSMARTALRKHIDTSLTSPFEG